MIIRKESVQDKELLEMLKMKVKFMISKLEDWDIYLNEEDVKIWIKEFNGKLYPKIEFDFNKQELQYDLTEVGQIKEAHFKSFRQWKGKFFRKDLKKEKADLFLQTIDNIIRFNCVCLEEEFCEE